MSRDVLKTYNESMSKIKKRFLDFGRKKGHVDLDWPAPCVTVKMFMWFLTVTYPYWQVLENSSNIFRNLNFRGMCQTAFWKIHPEKFIGKIFGWVFQDLPIKVNCTCVIVEILHGFSTVTCRYWQILENSSKKYSETSVFRDILISGKLILKEDLVYKQNFEIFRGIQMDKFSRNWPGSWPENWNFEFGWVFQKFVWLITRKTEILDIFGWVFQDFPIRVEIGIYIYNSPR